MKTGVGAVPALGTVLLSCGAFAQAWPLKAIRVFVPFRPGTGGNLGVDAAAKSLADGYAIVLGRTSNLAINPTLYAKMPYDAQRDLAPLVTTTDTGSPYEADVVAGHCRPACGQPADPIMGEHP